MKQTEETTLRQRLKAYLEKEGISPKDFAASIGRSDETVRGYLRTGVTPKVDVFVIIARRYPTWSLAYLLTGKGEPYKEESHTSPKEEPQTHKDATLHWLALRDKLRYDLEVLPLDGIQFVYEDALREVATLLEENEVLKNNLESLVARLLTY